MSEADWTPSPHVEREAAYLRRRTRWEGRLSVWIAGVTTVAAVISGCVFVGSLRYGAPAQIFVSGVLSVGAGALTLLLAIRDNELVSRVRAGDGAKRDEFGAGAGWIVDILVLQGAAPTGADRGMLWIEEGRLCFSGDRTSFSLSSDQVAGRCQSLTPVAGLRHATCLPLVRQTPAGPLVLSLQLADSELGLVRGAIDGWTSSNSTGGQFPPTHLGPGAVATSRLFLNAALGTAYWSLASLLVCRAFQAGIGKGAVMLVLAALGGTILRCVPLATRWRAYRDRRRLGWDGL